jgi:thiosulfate reductase cytochrome b subunit
MERIYLYTRFERFWHWAQAGLILLLVATGLEVHGAFRLFGFDSAVNLHNWTGFSWFVLYAFILFWQATTGEWKHYIPTTRKLMTVAHYYLYGIFHGEPHPVPKSERNKHNPLQRLTYLSLSLLLIPVQVATGFLLYTYNSWLQWGIPLSLGTVALIHTAGAFGLVTFLVVHVYMTTTGHRLTCHIKAMCTGWEEVPANGGTVPDGSETGVPGGSAARPPLCPSCAASRE